MHLTGLHYLFLIPVGLALAFMFWVLWSLTEQLAHRNESTDKQPVISIRVGDRYSLGTVSQRAPRSDSGVRPGYGASREYSQPPSAPTLGMGLRRMSSSTIQGAHK
jgi:hypothetical protein